MYLAETFLEDSRIEDLSQERGPFRRFREPFRRGDFKKPFRGDFENLFMRGDKRMNMVS